MSIFKKYVSEVGVGVVLLLLLALFFHPLYFWMPNALSMMFMLALFISWVVFAVFVWREQSGDEREVLHRMIAARVSFLAGSGALVMGIVAQSITHTLDPWLVVTLSIMIIAKIGGHIYVRSHC